jgi:hypothetical protein
MKYIKNTNAEILDALKEVYKIKSDRALTKKLEISSSFVSAVRREKKNFSRTKMLEIEKTLKEAGVIVTSFIPDIEESDGRHLEFINDITAQANSIQTLKDALGKCELCKMNAPFIDKNNSPYLKIIQIIPAAYGGAYDLSNLAALCPNCAAKMDIRGDADDVKYLIQLKKTDNIQ